MNERNMVKTVFKKQIPRLKQALSLKTARCTQAKLDASLIQCKRFQELLSIFDLYFSRTLQAETTSVLHGLTEALEESRKENIFLDLLTRLARDVKKTSAGPRQKLAAARKKFEEAIVKKSGLERIIEETSDHGRQAMGTALGKLKRVNLKSRLRDIAREAGAAGPLQPGFLTRILNERRKALFNQIVEIIRTSQKEDFNRLQFQVEKFIYLLELAVAVRHEKAKRLLQVVKLLFERLVWVQDEEMFGRYLRELEKLRAGDAERVTDVQELREILRRLGIVEAHTLQALHAQLPVSLQFLKRDIV